MVEDGLLDVVDVDVSHQLQQQHPIRNQNEDVHVVNEDVQKSVLYPVIQLILQQNAVGYHFSPTFEEYNYQQAND